MFHSKKSIMTWIKSKYLKAKAINDRLMQRIIFVFIIHLCLAYFFVKGNENIGVLVILSIYGIVGIFFKQLLLPFITIWLFIGFILGNFIGWILMGVLYFSLITLIGLFIKYPQSGWIKSEPSEMKDLF